MKRDVISSADLGDQSLPLEIDGDHITSDVGRISHDESIGGDLLLAESDQADAHDVPAPPDVIEEAPLVDRPTGFNASGHGFFFSTSDDNDKLLALGDRVDHCKSLLSEGWRATRWEHPEHGVVENTTTGGWKWTLRSGTTIEGAGSDRKTFVNGKLVAVDGRKVNP